MEIIMMYLEMNFEFIEMIALFGTNIDSQEILDYLQLSFENSKYLGKSIESVQKALVFCYFVFTSSIENGGDFGQNESDRKVFSFSKTVKLEFSRVFWWSMDFWNN